LVTVVLPAKKLIKSQRRTTVYAKQSVYEHHQEFVEQFEAEPQTERTFLRKDKASYNGYLGVFSKSLRKKKAVGKARKARCKSRSSKAQR
jgi:hypothetical protein